MDMTCEKFEESLAGYLDKELEPGSVGEFAEHALRCSGCRALLDDVKVRLREPLADLDHNSPEFEMALETIAVQYAGVDCSRFQELVTEFLDGYVPATIYHQFGEHSAECGACSKLLTEVVYAVAACHSVHTYEALEVPADLTESLLSIGERCGQTAQGSGQISRISMDQIDRKVCQQPAKSRLGGREASSGGGSCRLAGYRLSLLARTFALAGLTRMATAAAIVGTTFALVISGFSADLTLKGIYHQAQVKVAAIYSQNLDIHTEKEGLASRFEQVGSDFNAMFKTIGRVRGQGAYTAQPEQTPASTDKTE